MAGRTIYSSIWDEPWFHTFTPDAKLLFLYFVTSPLANPSGIYSILPGLIAAHTGLRGVRLDRALDGITERCCYDPDDGVVWVKNFLRVQAGEVKAGSKFLISALNHALRGPKRFLRDFLEHNRDLLGGLPAYPTDTLSVGYREGIDTPKREGLVPPPLSGSGSVPPSGLVTDPGSEGGRGGAKPLRVSARSPEQIAADIEAILAATGFRDSYQALADILAAENKRGKVAASRLLTTLLQPLWHEEQQRAGDEAGRIAFEYGLQAAIQAGAPNVNYVKRATEGALKRGTRAETRAGVGIRRSDAGPREKDWHEV